MKIARKLRVGMAALVALIGLAAGPAGATVVATGGNYTNDIDGYRIHTFTNSATASNFVVSVGGDVEVLVVGGGGGGGKGYYGGGGGGGLIYSNVYPVVAGSNYAVIVGSGGVGASSYTAQGGSGSDSKFDTSLVAKGGGGGGSRNNAASGGAANGANGGSGGGIGVVDSTRGLATQPALGGFGNDGAPTAGRQSNSYGCGGGGAGAAAPDTAINSGETYSLGGVGGNGKAYDLAGTNQYYAGGGGGGACATSDTRSPASTAGGLGGGGRGGRITDYSPDPGANGLGGGGGGGGNDTDNGANGGSGIVIVRYALATGTPVIANLPATNVTATSANLNGILSTNGASAATVRVYWGTTDGATTAGNWQHTNEWATTFSAGSALTTNITGLSSNTLYYYRYYATNDLAGSWAPSSETFITGEVGVRLTADGAEQGSVPILFSVYRPASGTNVPATVLYSVSGSASNGLDYPLLSGSATIPIGATNASISVVPYHDQLTSEGAETVILTLAPGAYNIGFDASATTGTIADATSKGFYVATTGNDASNGTSWVDALLTISNALAKATNNNDEIIVGAGTYNIAVQLNVTNGVTVRSDAGAASTIVARSSASNFRIFYMTDANAVIDGFTIRDGADDGGGVYLTKGTVRNCIIRNNKGNQGAYGSGYGGGVYMTGGLVEKCIITANSAQQAGWSQGGGVYMTGGLLRQCAISSNVAYNTYWNTAGSAGGGLWMSGGTGENCIVSANLLSDGIGADDGGGGVRIGGGVLRNCTIAANAAAAGSGHAGGGVRQTGGTVVNCIMANNSAPTSPDYSGSAQNVTYCRAPELGTGLGNITFDPRFTSAATGDYTLQYSSPCVDTGTNMTGVVTNDYAGTARPLDGFSDGTAKWDMGAYELQAGTSQSALICSLTADRTFGLAPLTAVFTAHVAGPASATNIASYSWDFGGGGAPQAGADMRVVTNIFAVGGTFTVTLTVSNSLQQVATDIKTNYTTTLGTTYYVATNGANVSPYATWANAANSPAVALALAKQAISLGVTGAVINVSTGTYSIGSQLTLDQPISMVGAGATSTIMQCSVGNIRVFSMTHGSAILDGLTICNANNDSYSSGLQGAGIVMTTGLVRNCTIRNNQARAGGNGSNYGGGVNISGGTVENCVITNNTVAGYAGSQGGGVYMTGGTVRRCLVAYNAGSANSAGEGTGGGIMMASGSPVVENCIVRNNTLADSTPTDGGGGGVRVAAGTLRNCTVVTNACTGAGHAGGGIRQTGGTVVNCIAFYNTAGASPNYGGAGATFTCTPDGLTPGANGNIAPVDPKFTSVSTSDFRLLGGSPCIDTGSNLVGLVDDVLGQPRPVDGGLGVAQDDMGAYEYQGSPDLTCSFNGTPQAGLVPVSCVFTGRVSGLPAITNVAYWWWTFGDGQTAEGANAWVTTNNYSQVGAFTVSLVVSNSVGTLATNTQTGYITVLSTNVYVSTNGADTSPYASWATAARKIEDAVSVARQALAAGAPRVQVLVSTGTFSMAAETVLDAPITLSGAGAGTTIVHQSAANLRVFSLTTSTPVLENLTIENGSPQDFAGGVYMTTGTVRNCTIRNNWINSPAAGSAHGGGITMSGGLVENCTITNNTAIGYFSGYGGGVEISGGVLRRCVVVGNVARGNNANFGIPFEKGGGIVLSGSGIVEDCLVYGNTLSDGGADNNQGGGGVRIEGGILRNCTIVSNRADGAQMGSGVLRTGGALVNNIIYLNTGANGTNYSGALFAVTNSCSPELMVGVQGNITNDPMFKASAQGNFRITLGSPCMNTGLMETWMTNAFDLDGVPRLRGNVDMGAYECTETGGSVFTFR